MNVGDVYKYVGTNLNHMGKSIEIVNIDPAFGPNIFEYVILGNRKYTYVQDEQWLKDYCILVSSNATPINGNYSLNLPFGFTVSLPDFLQGVSQQSIDEMSQFEIKMNRNAFPVCECGTSKVYGSNIDKSMHSSYCPINKN